MTKMAYPVYKREENLNCKLTDEQIAQIRLLRKRKMKIKDIALMFNVVESTIKYWLSDNRRNRQIKSAVKRSAEFSKNNRQKRNEINKKSRQRKYSLYKKEIIQWLKEIGHIKIRECPFCHKDITGNLNSLN